jgi:hypothetical protein
MLCARSLGGAGLLWQAGGVGGSRTCCPLLMQDYDRAAELDPSLPARAQVCHLCAPPFRLFAFFFSCLHSPSIPPPSPPLSCAPHPHPHPSPPLFSPLPVLHS